MESSRLTFVDRPSFDPVPYLDSESRAVYCDPIARARPLEEGEAVPRVAVRCSRAEALRLLHCLDKSGRLAFVDSSLVRERLRSGIFAIPKDLHRDRMVLDARPPNQVEPPADRWINSLASLTQLQHLFVGPTEKLELFVEDLREFYHAFEVGERRVLRNTLALDFCPSEVAHFDSFPTHLLQVKKVAPALNFGDGRHSAVALAQTASVSAVETHFSHPG